MKGKPMSTEDGYFWNIQKKLSNKQIGKSRTQKRTFKAKRGISQKLYKRIEPKTRVPETTNI